MCISHQSYQLDETKVCKTRLNGFKPGTSVWRHRRGFESFVMTDQHALWSTQFSGLF
jgi:hypothetical protein